MKKCFKEYLRYVNKYVYNNLITGKCNLGIIMILTIILFAILSYMAMVSTNTTLILLPICESIIGVVISISYANFDYDRKKK